MSRCSGCASLKRNVCVIKVFESGENSWIFTLYRRTQKQLVIIGFLIKMSLVSYLDAFQPISLYD